MRWKTIEIRVDRDSVAMGDDMVSHAKTTTIPRGTLVSDAIEQCSPEIRIRGWSWVAVVDGEVSAVWSIDHGTRLLVADRMLKRGGGGQRGERARRANAITASATTTMP